MRVHVRRAGLDLTAPLTIHTLRKSFAQNHANNGTPSATLKTLMGHVSITTTENYYMQRSDEAEQAATRRYEALLGGKTAVGMLYGGGNTPGSSPAKRSPLPVTLNHPSTSEN